MYITGNISIYSISIQDSISQVTTSPYNKVQRGAKQRHTSFHSSRSREGGLLLLVSPRQHPAHVDPDQGQESFGEGRKKRLMVAGKARRTVEA